VVQTAEAAPHDLIELGRIVSAYGVKGWVKIQPHSAQADVLLSTSTWWLKAPVPRGKQGAFSRRAGGTGSVRNAQDNMPEGMMYRVQASRFHTDSVVAQLESVNDRDQAEAMKGYTVWAPRSAFPAPDDDEYYWIDLIGCRLYGEQDTETVLLGEILEVIDNGVHGVLRVARACETESGALERLLNEKGRPQEVLVPFVQAHVYKVDLKNKSLYSNWPTDW
jgi:16S rRNA processing protein RimM|tara:strand:- start:75897 stop:76559 length:663 start_codon:yes stop_codon:yes gene_type:complete